MKKIKWIIPLFCACFLCGCNYHELNEIYLVSALSVDYDTEYHVSLLTVSDDEEGTTREITGSGKTIEETFHHINTNYNKPLYLGHLNLIIIDEKAAKRGIKSLLQIINEDNETKKNFYLILAKDTKAKEVLTYLSSEKLEAKETEGISKYLNLENIHNQITYNTYTKQMKENNITTLTSYTIQNEQLETSSLGVLKNHKLKAWIKESDATLVLNNRLKEMAITQDQQTIIVKNLSVKKKLSGDSITFYVNGKVDNSIKDLNAISNKLKVTLQKALTEQEDIGLDYLRLKPFLYDYKQNTNIPLNKIQPKINVQITW